MIFVITMSFNILVLITFAYCSSGQPITSDEATFPIRMPRVKPKLPNGESYLCTAFDTDPNETLYITEIEPANLAMETVHHLMLIGCSSLQYGGENELESKNLWNCGGSLGEKELEYAPTCQGGEMQVIYMWSRNGSGIRYPENSGMAVGGISSNIRLLVLQVHYIDNERIPRGGDTSGVMVTFTKNRPEKSVGIVSLHVHGLLQPRSVSYWDTACKFSLPDGQVIHPFAFLTHTHKYGIHASGWIVRDNTTWTPIGARNPQEPQSFYPAETEDLNVSSEDVVAARCILSSQEDQVIMQGLTSKMEMCDYFILYWTFGSTLGSENSCTTKANFTWKSYGLVNDPFLNSD